jgi:glycosyltransferase involved in cell wall biosynthesis
MRKVLYFRTELLPQSETFIVSQAGALRSFQPVFAGLRRVPFGISLNKSSVLLTERNALRDKLKRRIWLRSGIAPRFHRETVAMQPALLHVHFATDAAIALPLHKRLGVPLVVTLHGYDVTTSDEALRASMPGRAYICRRRELYRQTSLFLCVSEHIRQKAIERGFPAQKLYTHHIGVDLSDCSSTPGERAEQIILFVGRLVEKKGCSHLLQAMTRVQAANPAACLVILGDGPLRGQLESQARQTLHHCVFLGLQPPVVVREWMRRARLLVAPSIVAANGDSEGLPIVLCEAQSMGLPIAGYCGPGVSEAVTGGETALLVQQGNIQALAGAIGRLLRDDALAATTGQAGRRRAELHFDLSKQTAILEEKYASLLERWTLP